MKYFSAFGAFLVLTGTALGAVAAHVLRASLGPEEIHIFEKAVMYQLINGVALFSFAERYSGRKLAALTISIGVALFCGGLYSRAILGAGGFASVAPAGGSLIMIGWLIAMIGTFLEPRNLSSG